MQGGIEEVRRKFMRKLIKYFILSIFLFPQIAFNANKSIQLDSNYCWGGYWTSSIDTVIFSPLLSYTFFGRTYFGGGNDAATWDIGVFFKNDSYIYIGFRG